MAILLSEQELRKQAIQALTEKLGPLEALRLLALVSREPFDYQRWRKEYFSRYNVDELSKEIRRLHGGMGSWAVSVPWFDYFPEELEMDLQAL
ncbi:MAG: hypothetical protein ACE5JU_21060 [Candidatus Binatia bacterium]